MKEILLAYPCCGSFRKYSDFSFNNILNKEGRGGVESLNKEN
jgi:hypothetical protein